MEAFNGAADLQPIFAKLKDQYQISTVIETGTFKGKTTAFFGKLFDEVHTIDISPEYYYKARQTLSNFTNIHFHLGSSEKILSGILPTLQDRFILFYLDAHWNEYWPLRDELEIIARTHANHCIVVIDDIKVPDRSDIAYDFYGPHECSYEYVKDKIEKIFPNYTMEYLIPENVYNRAKLLILPSNKASIQ